MRGLIGILAAAVLASPAMAEEAKKVTLTGDNTKIEFVGSKADGKHDGGFKKLSGSASMSGSDLGTLKIEVVIDTNSIYSDVPKLTAHLKSPDFFDVKTNPTATFTSSKVAKGDDGHMITGELTLCGKKKEISFPAKITVADGKLTIKSEFKIDRRDFGMTFGEGKVHNDVQIKVALEATK
jgi:polyisoprenoid-binding protein YceI